MPACLPDLRAQEDTNTMPTDLKRTALAARVWRKNAQGSIKDMPADLQRNVVKLLEDHSWEDVCQAVGISRSSLGYFRRCHRDQLQLRPRVFSRKSRSVHERHEARPTALGKANDDFIELPIVGAQPRLHVELRLPSGIVVHAHSAIDAGAVCSFVSKVIADTAAAA
jgi:hypothetical protein